VNASEEFDRQVAIQCVAELHRGVAILDEEIPGGVNAPEVLDTISAIASILSLLAAAVRVDGRPQHGMTSAGESDG